jgi:hypothetical protein
MAHDWWNSGSDIFDFADCAWICDVYICRCGCGGKRFVKRRRYVLRGDDGQA